MGWVKGMDALRQTVGLASQGLGLAQGYKPLGIPERFILPRRCL
jgi:hypothetical protein